MKSVIKSILLIFTGALAAAGLLFGYSYFVQSIGLGEGDETLSFVEIEPGDAVISHISGEVYIIREEKILSPEPGDAIREGDVIKVVDDSWCQVHFVGKATMNLRSNTLLRIQKLLTSTKDIDVRTELLTGSMIYKVDRLSVTDKLEVLAQEKIYRVEGTEFYVDSDGGSRVSVREGKVAVLLKQENEEQLIRMVPAGESLDLGSWKQGEELPENRSLSSADKTIFDQESPRLLEGSPDSLVYLEIKTSPGDAQLYLDGRLNSKGHLSGLFDPAKPLNILVRKRGYRDLVRRVIPGEMAASRMTLTMEALGLEESLREESETPPPESMEELKARFEAESETLKDDFSRQILASRSRLKEMEDLSLRLQREINSLEGSRLLLSDEKRELETRLKESQEEQEKLRQLLLQIQELSADQ